MGTMLPTYVKILSSETVTPRLMAPKRSSQSRPPMKSADLLIQLLARAVQLHDYSGQVEPEASLCHDRLAHLSAQFDRAHERALALGLPVRARQDVRWANRVYQVVLTDDGLEYQPQASC